MIIAIDQYGDKIILTSQHPRKELLDKLGATHIDKIYIDTKQGGSKHVGYIVQGNWYTFYNLTEWTGKI